MTVSLWNGLDSSLNRFAPIWSPCSLQLLLTQPTPAGIPGSTCSQLLQASLAFCHLAWDTCKSHFFLRQVPTGKGEGVKTPWSKSWPIKMGARRWIPPSFSQVTNTKASLNPISMIKLLMLSWGPAQWHTFALAFRWVTWPPPAASCPGQADHPGWGGAKDVATCSVFRLPFSCVSGSYL